MQIGELLTEDKRAQQFTLFDIFAAMTLAAILLAMFVPWIRWMKPDQRMRLLIPMGLQFFMLVGAAALAIHRRRTLVEKGGRRFGIAFFGTAKWSGWLPIKSILLMVLLAVLQIFIAIGMSFTPEHSMVTLINSAQLAFVLAHFGVNFLWRVYPTTLEFFESGVASSGQLFPWSDVEVRDSQFFADRIGVMLTPKGANFASFTRMARVSEALRKEIDRRSKSAAD